MDEFTLQNLDQLCSSAAAELTQDCKELSPGALDCCLRVLGETHKGGSDGGLILESNIFDGLLDDVCDDSGDKFVDAVERKLRLSENLLKSKVRRFIYCAISFDGRFNLLVLDRRCCQAFYFPIACDVERQDAVERLAVCLGVVSSCNRPITFSICRHKMVANCLAEDQCFLIADHCMTGLWVCSVVRELLEATKSVVNSSLNFDQWTLASVLHRLSLSVDHVTEERRKLIGLINAKQIHLEMAGLRPSLVSLVPNCSSDEDEVVHFIDPSSHVVNCSTNHSLIIELDSTSESADEKKPSQLDQKVELNMANDDDLRLADGIDVGKPTPVAIDGAALGGMGGDQDIDSHPGVAHDCLRMLNGRLSNVNSPGIFPGYDGRVISQSCSSRTYQTLARAGTSATSRNNVASSESYDDIRKRSSLISSPIRKMMTLQNRTDKSTNMPHQSNFAQISIAPSRHPSQQSSNTPVIEQVYYSQSFTGFRLPYVASPLDKSIVAAGNARMLSDQPDFDGVSTNLNDAFDCDESFDICGQAVNHSALLEQWCYNRSRLVTANSWSLLPTVGNPMDRRPVIAPLTPRNYARIAPRPTNPSIRSVEGGCSSCSSEWDAIKSRNGDLSRPAVVATRTERCEKTKCGSNNVSDVDISACIADVVDDVAVGKLERGSGKSRFSTSTCGKSRFSKCKPFVKWPCGKCGKNCAFDSIQCHLCHKWWHRKCTGPRRTLTTVEMMLLDRNCEIKWDCGCWRGKGDSADWIAFLDSFKKGKRKSKNTLDKKSYLNDDLEACAKVIVEGDGESIPLQDDGSVCQGDGRRRRSDESPLGIVAGGVSGRPMRKEAAKCRQKIELLSLADRKRTSRRFDASLSEMVDDSLGSGDNNNGDLPREPKAARRSVNKPKPPRARAADSEVLDRPGICREVNMTTSIVEDTHSDLEKIYLKLSDVDGSNCVVDLVDDVVANVARRLVEAVVQGGTIDDGRGYAVSRRFGKFIGPRKVNWRTKARRRRERVRRSRRNQGGGAAEESVGTVIDEKWQLDIAPIAEIKQESVRESSAADAVCDCQLNPEAEQTLNIPGSSASIDDSSRNNCSIASSDLETTLPIVNDQPRGRMSRQKTGMRTRGDREKARQYNRRWYRELQKDPVAYEKRKASVRKCYQRKKLEDPNYTKKRYERYRLVGGQRQMDPVALAKRKASVRKYYLRKKLEDPNYGKRRYERYRSAGGQRQKPEMGRGGLEEDVKKVGKPETAKSFTEHFDPAKIKQECMRESSAADAVCRYQLYPEAEQTLNIPGSLASLDDASLNNCSIASSDLETTLPVVDDQPRGRKSRKTTGKRTRDPEKARLYRRRWYRKLQKDRVAHEKYLASIREYDQRKTLEDPVYATRRDERRRMTRWQRQMGRGGLEYIVKQNGKPETAESFKEGFDPSKKQIKAVSKTPPAKSPESSPNSYRSNRDYLVVFDETAADASLIRPKQTDIRNSSDALTLASSGDDSNPNLPSTSGDVAARKTKIARRGLGCIRDSGMSGTSRVDSYDSLDDCGFTGVMREIKQECMRESSAADALCCYQLNPEAKQTLNIPGSSASLDDSSLNNCSIASSDLETTLRVVHDQPRRRKPRKRTGKRTRDREKACQYIRRWYRELQKDPVAYEKRKASLREYYQRKKQEDPNYTKKRCARRRLAGGQRKEPETGRGGLEDGVKKDGKLRIAKSFKEVSDPTKKQKKTIRKNPVAESPKSPPKSRRSIRNLVMSDAPADEFLNQPNSTDVWSCARAVAVTSSGDDSNPILPSTSGDVAARKTRIARGGLSCIRDSGMSEIGRIGRRDTLDDCGDADVMREIKQEPASVLINSVAELKSSPEPWLMESEQGSYHDRLPGCAIADISNNGFSRDSYGDLGDHKEGKLRSDNVVPRDRYPSKLPGRKGKLRRTALEYQRRWYHELRKDPVAHENRKKSIKNYYHQKKVEDPEWYQARLRKHAEQRRLAKQLRRSQGLDRNKSQQK